MSRRPYSDDDQTDRLALVVWAALIACGAVMGGGWAVCFDYTGMQITAWCIVGAIVGGIAGFFVYDGVVS